MYVISQTILIVKNNLNNVLINKIPDIEIKEDNSISNSINIKWNSNVNLVDLYLVIKSYACNVEIIIKQTLIKVIDLEEQGREFYMDSVSPEYFQYFSFLEFNKWYFENWNKAAKYLKNEVFELEIVLLFLSKKKNHIYPIFPWSEYVLNQAFNEEYSKKMSYNYLMNEIERLKKIIEDNDKK